jgi:hypothetical protein
VPPAIGKFILSLANTRIFLVISGTQPNNKAQVRINKTHPDLYLLQITGDNVSLAQSVTMLIKACSFVGRVYEQPPPLSRKLNNKMLKLTEKINEGDSKNFEKMGARKC